MGPHTFNFAEAAVLAQAAGAAQGAPNMSAGVRQAVQLAGNPLEQAKSARAALTFAAAHQGAAAKTIQALARYF